MIEVIPYEERWKEPWDSFVLSSNNGTMFHLQRFLEYHSRPFPWHHLLFLKKGEIQAVLPAMLEQGSGSIINISSVNALRSNAGQAGYDATKWAVRGMTKSLAMEFGGRGIRVNSVHPGAINTPMLDPDGSIDGALLARQLRIAAGRLGEPDEVAFASLFLASDEASYVNGAEIAVDGGWAAGLVLSDVEVDSKTKISQ